MDQNKESIILDDINIGSYQFSKDWRNQNPVILDKLEIKNCKNFHYIYTSDLRIRQVVVENMTGGSKDGGFLGGDMHLGGNNVFVRNNDKLGSIGLTIYNEDGIYTTDKTMEVSGNVFLDSSAQIQIHGDTQNSSEYKLTCTNNSKCKNIDFYYLNEIKELNIDFDADSLQSLRISSCTITEQALQNVVDALATPTFSNQVTLWYDNSQPALNQAQLDALAANNINVQSS